MVLLAMLSLAMLAPCMGIGSSPRSSTSNRLLAGASRKQQEVAGVLGSLPPSWEIQMSNRVGQRFWELAPDVGEREQAYDTELETLESV